jgi:hypothetical protein
VITFRDAGDCKDQPRLVTTKDCEACTSIRIRKGEAEDLCKVLGGNPAMYVEATCCDGVPVRRETWGRLKTLFR